MPYGSEITIGNFDFTITSSGQIKLFECGPGICGVGYEGYKTDNSATMHDRIFAHLLTKFDKLLIINYGRGLLLRLCSRGFERDNTDRFETFNSLIDIKDYVQRNPGVNAAIVVDRINTSPQHSHIKEPLVAQQCQELGLALPVISSSDMYRMLGDKAFFADVFGRYLPAAIPKSWVIDRTSVESRLKELLSSSIDWFIVKASQGNRAEGSSIFHRTDLPFLFLALQNKSLDGLEAHGATPHQLTAITDLIAMLDSSNVLIIQEMVIPTLRKDNRGETYACTGRFVFSLSRNEEGATATLIDGMWKYALEPFSDCVPPNPKSIISCVLKRKFTNLSSNQSALLASNVEINYTDSFELAEKESVRRFVEQDLSQFFSQFQGDLQEFLSHSNGSLSPETRYYLAKNIECIAYSRPLENQFQRDFSASAPKLPAYTLTRLKIANLLLSIGIERLKSDENTLALDNLESSCKLLSTLLTEPNTAHEKNNIRQGLATSHYNLATVYGRLRNNQQAYHHCLQALIHRISMNVDEAIVDRTKQKLITLLPVSGSKNPLLPLYNAACSDFERKEYNHAIKKLRITQELYDAADDKVSLSRTFSTLASCYREIGNYEQGSEACKQALRVLNNLPEEERSVAKELRKKIENKLSGIEQLTESSSASSSRSSPY